MNKGIQVLIKQVRDEQFEKELDRVELAANKDKDAAVEKALLEAQQNNQKAISDKDLEIERLKAAAEAEVVKAQFELKATIAELKSQIENAETIQALEISEKMKEAESETMKLRSALESKDLKFNMEKSNLEQKHLQELQAKDEFIKMKESWRYKDFKQRQSTKMIGSR